MFFILHFKSDIKVFYFFFKLDVKEDADLWLLNSCTVKNPAEDHFRNEIKKATELSKKAVVAGCVPQGQPRADYLQVYL